MAHSSGTLLIAFYDSTFCIWIGSFIYLFPWRLWGGDIAIYFCNGNFYKTSKRICLWSSLRFLSNTQRNHWRETHRWHLPPRWAVTPRLEGKRNQRQNLFAIRPTFQQYKNKQLKRRIGKRMSKFISLAIFSYKLFNHELNPFLEQVSLIKI